MLTSKIEKKRFKRNVKINFTLDHEKYLPRLEAKILRISFFLSRKVYSSILKESRMIYDEREKEREREGERELPTKRRGKLFSYPSHFQEPVSDLHSWYVDSVALVRQCTTSLHTLKMKATKMHSAEAECAHVAQETETPISPLFLLRGDMSRQKYPLFVSFDIRRWTYTYVSFRVSRSFSLSRSCASLFWRSWIWLGIYTISSI